MDQTKYEYYPFQFKPQNNNLVIEGIVSSEQLSDLEKFIEEHCAATERYNINSEPYEDKRRLRLGITDICKDDVPLVDYLNSTTKKNIVDLEEEFHPTIKQQTYLKVHSFRREFTPENLKKNVIKHGPWIGGIVIGVGTLEHFIIPTGIAVVYKQPWLGGLAAVLSALHPLEILSIGAYFWIKNKFSKTKKYGKKLDPLLNDYLNSLFKGTHEKTEKTEIKIENLLEKEREIISDLENLFNYEKRFLTTHNREDFKNIGLASIRLQKKLGGEGYRTLKGYASAVALEHLAENPQFRSDEILTYVVAKDQLLESVRHAYRGDVLELFQKRLKSHE